MIEESKYCIEVMTKHFNEELLITKNIMKILRTLLNVGFLVILTFAVMLK